MSKVSDLCDNLTEEQRKLMEEIHRVIRELAPIDSGALLLKDKDNEQR